VGGVLVRRCFEVTLSTFSEPVGSRNTADDPMDRVDCARLRLTVLVFPALSPRVLTCPELGLN
jgi:hypothetical protein